MHYLPGNDQIMIVGVGGFRNNVENVDVMASTRTTITVKWGDTSKKFCRNTGRELPLDHNWSGWKLPDKDIIK